MQVLLPLNKIPLMMDVDIKTKTPTKMMIELLDSRKPKTTYIRRVATVNGTRKFYLALPTAPTTALLRIYNVSNGNLPTNIDHSFIIDRLNSEDLQKCNTWISKDTISFIKFAQEFSENASILSAGNKLPSIYRSKDAKFSIDYYNKIFDKATNSVIGTPARIGHTTGVIEVSKQDFIRYTIPMRMIILLHEYSHKYLNPKHNRPIGYETGADVNALSIYLGLGYPPSEAHFAFLNVFKTANNEENRKRYLIIKDFIDKFTTGKIKGSCKLKTNIKND